MVVECPMILHSSETTAPYRTQNLYEASYLLCRGHRIQGTERLGTKITLLFEGSGEVQQDALGFYNGGRVKAKEYSDAYRTLKDMVFQR
jgi:hypothetical protein